MRYCGRFQDDHDKPIQVDEWFKACSIITIFDFFPKHVKIQQNISADRLASNIYNLIEVLR